MKDITEKIINNINELKSLNGARNAKYIRNYRLYNYSAKSSLFNLRNPNIVGYFQTEYGIEDDVTSTPQLNVVKSCIDTLVSKIAQSKVRPFFNCINGTFKDIQIVKQSQQFFDQYFEFQNVNKIVPQAFKDACIFDTGWVYVNPFTKNIEKALPFQVYVRPSEMTYGKLTRVYYEQNDYPVSLLSEDLQKKIHKINENLAYVIYGVYFDTVEHKVVQYINVLGTDDLIIEDYQSDVIPFIPIFYSSPILGNSSQSIADMLNSIQVSIDCIMAKINEASQLNNALTFFVPDGSDLKVQQLNNRIGNVVRYRANADVGGNPISTVTPQFINEQYFSALEQLKQNAYEMVGISQLSAQSKKPSGLNSGIALSTMEDVESERFETQLNQIIRCYVDITKVCMKVFNPNETILPYSQTRVSIKWKDIVDESDKMVIQFSGADALSKDPSVKLQQLQLLAQAGILPQSRIAQFMEIPDINTGYSLSNNAINAVLSVIDDCIQKDNFDIPDYVPFSMLKEEIINTQLSLRSANYDENKKDIEKLQMLYAIAEEKEKEWMSTVNQATANIQNSNTNNEDNPLPQSTNILTQEANMTSATPNNMDMQTSIGDGGWDRK